MAQAASRRPLFAEARDRARVSPCGICGRRNGIETVFLCDFRFTLSESFHHGSYSYIIWGMNSRPTGGPFNMNNNNSSIDCIKVYFNVYIISSFTILFKTIATFLAHSLSKRKKNSFPIYLLVTFNAGWTRVTARGMYVHCIVTEFAEVCEYCALR
jgi:hypothetical protein